MEGTKILFFSSLFSILLKSIAVDTITENQTIRDGETIVSARGEFEMGFFSPGSSNNRYFGIWYKKISNGTVIWVANREFPLTNTSGMVRVNSKGIIVLTNGSDSIIWSSNSSRSVTNPMAQLLDTGNLVFRDENESAPENFVWQSFDYPVDNILPGMKFGVDLVTGIDRYFTSWKSDDDPSPGVYLHRLIHTGFPQLLLWKGSVPWYRTGPWVGSQFSGIPFAKNTIYTNDFIISEKEIYYICNLVNSTGSAITRLALTPNGDSQRLVWDDRNQKWNTFLTLQVTDCDRYGFCGAYGSCNINNFPRCQCLTGFTPKSPGNWAGADWSDGCIRKVQLDCGKGEGFITYSGVKLPDTQISWYNMTMNLVECKRACLKNCSCTAYSNTDIRGGGSGCLLWFGDLTDIRGYSGDGQDLYVRMAASELEESKHSREKKRLRIILIPVLVVLTVLLGLILLLVFKKRRQKREGILMVNSESVSTNRNEREDLDLPFFEFTRIANATNDFSYNNKLGEGGYGPVYKGTLDDGQEIAVKRLSKYSRQGVDEFKNEVSCIAKLQHRNLVRLLGCCIENGERMLIYEYMPNKSLDTFIFDGKISHPFDWPKRYNIINGIARGLLYLHQDSRLRIIHRDLKASNILLDYEMNPKISDFGLARSFGGSETEANTTRVVGTYGYMPPEYAIDGLFSVKSDVYSFGVLVLEIVSGRKNRGFHHPDHNLNLLGHVWRSYNEGNLLEIIDEEILKSGNHNEVFRVFQIGLLCVQQYPEDRPSMSSVVLMLSSIISLPRPKEPGFFSERKPHEASSTSTNPKSSSFDKYSVTFFAPR